MRENPFSRPLDDIGWMLLNVPVAGERRAAWASGADLWTQAFESLELPDEAAAAGVHEPDNDVKIDAAWLANAVLGAEPQQRGKRLQQLAFGLRAFSTALPTTFGDVLTAIRALPPYRRLMLTLERMGITSPRCMPRRREQRGSFRSRWRRGVHRAEPVSGSDCAVLSHVGRRHS